MDMAADLKKADWAVLDRVFETIKARKGADPEVSYVAALLARGRARIAQKIGEEANETVIAAVQNDPDEVVRESADLIFHLMVLWAELDLSPQEICAELARREGISGLQAKAARAKGKAPGA